MQVLAALDFFGSNFHLYVNHQKKVFTRLGGVLTLISLEICIVIFSYLVNGFINREDPQITENDETSLEFKKISFKKENIYIPWSVANYNTEIINFTGLLYPIIYYYYGERDVATNEMPYDYKILNYTLCNETNLNTLDYFQDTAFDFNSLYCIDMGDLLVGGDWFHDFVYHIQMDIYLCEDGANIGTKGKKCTDYDDLIKMIGADNAWNINFSYPIIQFNSKDKTNPMKILYNSHYYNFNKRNTKLERLFLKENIIIDDQGWIFIDPKNTTKWGYDRIESDTYVRSDGNDFLGDFTSSRIYSFI